MSAPAVAGAAALVRQYFSQGELASYLSGAGNCGGDEDSSEGSGVYAKAGLCDSFSPKGYLVKAVLINSAMWLGDMQTVSYGETRSDEIDGSCWDCGRGGGGGGREGRVGLTRAWLIR